MDRRRMVTERSYRRAGLNPRPSYVQETQLSLVYKRTHNGQEESIRYAGFFIAWRSNSNGKERAGVYRKDNKSSEETQCICGRQSKADGAGVSADTTATSDATVTATIAFSFSYHGARYHRAPYPLTVQPL